MDSSTAESTDLDFQDPPEDPMSPLPPSTADVVGVSDDPLDMVDDDEPEPPVVDLDDLVSTDRGWSRDLLLVQ